MAKFKVTRDTVIDGKTVAKGETIDLSDKHKALTYLKGRELIVPVEAKSTTKAKAKE